MTAAQVCRAKRRLLEAAAAARGRLVSAGCRLARTASWCALAPPQALQLAHHINAGELEWVEAQKELVYTPEEFERYSKRKAKRRQPLDVKTIIEDLDQEAAATLSSKMYLKVRIHLVEGCEVNAEWVRQQLFGTNQFECTLIEDQPGAILAARLALDVTKWPEDAARGQMVRTVLFALLGEHATRIDIEQSLV